MAQQLGFRSRRRPAGYWDSEDRLDHEIAQFVAANWSQMQHPETDEIYWYNQVSASSRRTLHPRRHVLSSNRKHGVRCGARLFACCTCI